MAESTTPLPRVEDVVEEALDALSRNCKDLWASGPIDVLDRPPSALEFARDYVGPSRPVLIRGLVAPEHGFDVAGWDLASLAARADVRDARVTVAATPNGWADAVVAAAGGERGFVQPEEREMRFADFAAEEAAAAAALKAAHGSAGSAPE